VAFNVISSNAELVRTHGDDGHGADVDTLRAECEMRSDKLSVIMLISAKSAQLFKNHAG
jgi:hypothetical protein